MGLVCNKPDDVFSPRMGMINLSPVKIAQFKFENVLSNQPKRLPLGCGFLDLHTIAMADIFLDPLKKQPSWERFSRLDIAEEDVNLYATASRCSGGSAFLGSDLPISRVAGRLRPYGEKMTLGKIQRRKAKFKLVETNVSLGLFPSILSSQAFE